MAVDFLGRGWSFPPTFPKATRRVAMVQDLEDIDQSLHVLMSTRPGERVMLPGYGCDLDRFLFETVTASLLTEIRETVASAVTLWEPRIALVSVTVTEDRATAGLLLIDVVFTVRLTNTRSNLVFPFYLTEATLAGGG